MKYSVSDMNHELASVLYNIGALHSRLGAQEERQESDGMKMAVAHFQCAAWAFHSLPDKYPQDSDSDLSSEVLAFESGLCLAQAQECILEKSLLDNRKPGIIAKVCGQVVSPKRLTGPTGRSERLGRSESQLIALQHMINIIHQIY